MKLNRMLLYPKDIQRLTGRSDRHARTILANTRKALGKQPGQPVSIGEYCQYTGLSEDEVTRFLES